jgi:hypothetical protein
MFDRIVGALTFRRGIYNKVEKEHSFTSPGYLLRRDYNQLGTQSGFAAQKANNLVIGFTCKCLFVLLGFTFAVWITSWLGRTVYNAEVDFMKW